MHTLRFPLFLRRLLLGFILLVMAPAGLFAGSIDGHVVSGATPLASVTVQVYDAAGNYVDAGFTDIAGHYSVTGLSGGTYYARTFNSAGYVNELYDGQLCVSFCEPATGTAIVVPAAGTASGIDFDLDAGGLISGTVRDAASAPLGDISISILSAGGVFVSSAFTAADGTYTSNDGLPPGTYYVRTSNTAGFVNEIWNDVPCLATCAVTSATAITVVAGSTTAGIDFALAAGGRITGTITEQGTGTPLADVTVSVYDAAGNRITTGRTDASGVYVSQDGLPTASYFLVTSNTAGYLNQLWNGIPCVGFCSPASTANAIPVVAPATVAGKDFALALGGRVAGTVRASGTLVPLPNISVYVRDSSGNFVTSGFTDATGAYTSQDGLPAGNYFASVDNASGYINELYDNLPCPGGGTFCLVSGGTPVVVTAGGTTGGVDFLLDAGGRISGVVTDAATAAPLPGVSLTVLSATGATLANAFTSSGGTFLTGAGLPTGSYFLRTSNNQGYRNERYDDVHCDGTLCPTVGGTAISVTPPGTTSGIAIGLDAGGRIAGHVSDGSGTALAGVRVSVFDGTGNFVTGGRTDSVGNYRTDAGLPTGTYYIRTSNSIGYLDELYPNLPCHFGCSPTSGGGVPVTLPATTGGIDFVLDLGGRVTGTVTRTTGSVPLVGITVNVYTADGNFSRSARTDGLGHYSVIGLPAGTYRARTSNTQGYINELYDDIACPLSCSVTAGAPISVALGAATAGVDFALDEGGRVTGQVTSGGSPLNGVTVRIMNAAGLSLANATTDLSGHYLTANGLPTGTYYARTSNSQGYINELYDDVRCVGSCTTGLGAPIAVTAGSTTAGIDFALVMGGRVSGVVTDSATTVGIENVDVSILDASGRAVAFGFTDGFGVYTTGDGLPTGTYYARTSNFAGYLDEAYPDTPCLGSCPAVTGVSFAVTEGATRTGIDFALDAGGRISGRITDAATGNGLEAASVSVYDASGLLVARGFPNESGYYTTDTGLLPGTYFARTTSSGYINELYGGTICAGGCVVTSGLPIAVVGTATTTGIDFALAVGGRIAGQVTVGGVGTSGVSVQVYDTAGRQVSSGFTDFTGAYRTFDGLVTGSYYLRTSNGIGLVDQIYSGLPCLGSCTVTAGTAVAVTAGATTPAIDFALAAGGRIAGTVTSTATGLPLPNVTVALYDGAGTRLTTGTTDGIGAFLTPQGVPAGTYFARTENTFGYVDQVFAGIACTSSCSPATGTPLTLSAGAITPAVNFALDLDTDPDGDGIASTIDRNAATAADESAVPSSDFNDGPLGGTTRGTVALRSGWTVRVGDLSPGGVQARLDGAGAGAARIETCPAGGAEAVLLDVAGETARAGCSGNTTAVTAIVATPAIQLREPPTGAGTVVDLTTGQTVSLGSPIAASADNTQPVGVRFVDASGTTFGTLVLDPGETVDASVTAGLSVSVTVISGVVTATVRGEAVTLSAGQTHTFASPDATPPQMSCSATPDALWPPNGQMVAVTVSVSLTDTGSGPAGFVLDSVTSSEPGDPRRGPDVQGFVTGTPSTVGALRATRSGAGSRVYVLAYSGRDVAGNVATCRVTVTVPHDRRR